MHIVQTLTAIHDRYLTESPNSRMAVTEVYHWSRAAALFNQKLSAPIQPHDRDALWAAAALLGFISFASVEASKPEDAWPLKRLEKPGLEWLRMSEGKMAVWNLAEPWRPESIFHNLLVEKEHRHRLSAATRSSVEVMPAVFNELYGIDDSSTPDNNPYYSAVHSLARLLRIECNLPNVPTFLGFMKHFDLKGMRLLEQKDPRMLLLLAYWYAKVCHSAWWIERRATIECQGICLYLERYHADQTLIQELLEFPRLQCGLGSKYGTTFESICIP